MKKNNEIIIKDLIIKDFFKNYILFKMTQYARLTNFDYKQVDAKNKLKELCEPKLKNWVREAYASINQ